jgi:hypothetical protein
MDPCRHSPFRRRSTTRRQQQAGRAAAVIRKRAAFPTVNYHAISPSMPSSRSAVLITTRSGSGGGVTSIAFSARSASSAAIQPATERFLKLAARCALGRAQFESPRYAAIAVANQGAEVEDDGPDPRENLMKIRAQEEREG